MPNAIKPKAAKPKPYLTPAKRSAILGIATRLGGAAVAKIVDAVADDPTIYKPTAFGREMLESNLDNLVWNALVEELIARGKIIKLVTIGCEAPARDIVAAVAHLANAAGKTRLKPILTDVDDTLGDRRTRETFALAASVLAPTKQIVVYLDISGWALGIAVASSSIAEELVALARASRETLVIFDGEGLARLERQRKRMPPLRSPPAKLGDRELAR